MPAKRKNRSPRLTDLFHPLIKKTRNNSEEKASSSDIVLDALNMAESVTAKLDRIMERLETLSLIENRFDSMASTMANIESTLSRLDADVTMFKEGAGKRERRITDLENRLITMRMMSLNCKRTCTITEPSWTNVRRTSSI